MDREAENCGEHVTPDCSYCSSALERYRNGWICINSECPYRNSMQASGDAVSAECRSVTMADGQDENPWDRMSLDLDDDGGHQSHEQRHDYSREVPSNVDRTLGIRVIWPQADSSSSDDSEQRDEHSRESPSNVNGTQGSRHSAAQDLSHGEETDSSEGDGRMDIDTIDVEIHRYAIRSWVNERVMMGEERHSEVVQVLRSDILSSLAIHASVAASEVEQVLELSDDEDVEE